MKKSIFIVFICLSVTVFAQKKDEIIQRGIQVKRFFDQNVKDGDKEPALEKEEFYNFQGELAELKEYSNSGKDLDKWFKYKYDDEANLVEELEMNSKGEQKERIVYVYKKGLKVEKLTYDDKDRLVKRKVYEYGFRK